MLHVADFLAETKFLSLRRSKRRYAKKLAGFSASRGVQFEYPEGVLWHLCLHCDVRCRRLDECSSLTPCVCSRTVREHSALLPLLLYIAAL